MKNEAYLAFWSGTYIVRKYPSQEKISSGKNFGRVTYRARKKGYNVRVFVGFGSEVLKAIPS